MTNSLTPLLNHTKDRAKWETPINDLSDTTALLISGVKRLRDRVLVRRWRRSPRVRDHGCSIEHGVHMSFGLLGVREAARKDSTLKFTALLHHVHEDCLVEAFFNLKRSAAVGVDGMTWQEYERDLEANIADLHDRIHRGAYRAQPSRRVWIPKPDGRQRPLGIASLEDEIVQQAVLWVLQCRFWSIASPPQTIPR